MIKSSYQGVEMPQRESHIQGTPSWVDLTTDNLAESKAFYSHVLGWDFTEVPFGGVSYTMATLDGRRVAGLMQQNQEQIDHGPPPRWNTYLAVDDATKTIELVSGAGGQALMPPVELMDSGSMAAMADRSGTQVGLWQAGTHTGTQVVDELGALVWNELVTDDVPAVVAFFGSLFGWTTSEIETPVGPYTIFSVDGNPAGGIRQRAHDQIETHWETYFSVASIDDMLGVVGKTDGLIDEPSDIGFAKVAAVRDPQGAVFYAMEAINFP